MGVLPPFWPKFPLSERFMAAGAQFSLQIQRELCFLDHEKNPKTLKSNKKRGSWLEPNFPNPNPEGLALLRPREKSKNTQT